MLRWIALGLLAFSSVATAQPAESGAWNSLARTTWVGEGASKSGRQIYVFTDTECPYCHKLWKAMRPVLASHPDVQVRNILVAVINDDSLPRAQAVLASPNPSRALDRHQAAYEKAGLPKAKKNDAAVTAKIEANQDVMASYNLRGTPAILYRTDDGMIHRVSGVPDEAKLRDIFASAR